MPGRCEGGERWAHDELLSPFLNSINALSDYSVVRQKKVSEGKWMGSIHTVLKQSLSFKVRALCPSDPLSLTQSDRRIHKLQVKMMIV